MTGPDLRAALRDLGLTQAEFASLTGECRETISNRVTGKPGYPIPRYVETMIRLVRGESLDALLHEVKPAARRLGPAAASPR